MIRPLLVAAFERFPGLRRAAYAAWEPVLRFALLPFRRRHPRGRAVENPDLVARTAEYNQAAERYFAEYPDPGFLLAKPFSDSADFTRHLVDASILIAGARLQPGDAVLEIGAGSCWLSHLLNRYGCRTIAVDVSPAALALGRRLFERDPWTNWALEPRFLAYDGHRLPLDDGSCDRVLLYDAFHHVPNQRELLAEMHRVLGADGVAAMSEPGRGHASSVSSIAETADWGVLENELVVEDVAALAETAGFREVNVLVQGPRNPFELPVRGIGRFQGGQGAGRYWNDLCRHLEAHHHLLLHKGSSTPTTARPGRLEARLRLLRPAAAAASRGEPLHVVLRVRNTGDTRWLHRGVGEPRAGWTRLGVHLHEAGDPLGAVIDFDWHRAALDRDVDPGESFTARLDLPGIERPGRCDLLFDLVIEGTAWFADRGASKPPRLRVSVT